MASVENFINKAKDTADAAYRKTEDMVKIGKIKMEISRLEREETSIMEGLGRLMYGNRNGEDDISEQTDACMKRADELNARVLELRTQMAALQHQIRCSQCGAMNTEDSEYCRKCGTAL